MKITIGLCIGLILIGIAMGMLFMGLMCASSQAHRCEECQKRSRR